MGIFIKDRYTKKSTGHHVAEDVLADAIVKDKTAKELKMTKWEILFGDTQIQNQTPKMIDTVYDLEFDTYLVLGPAFNHEKLVAEAKGHRLDGKTQAAYDLMTAKNIIKAVNESYRVNADGLEFLRRDSANAQLADLRVVAKRLALIFQMREWDDLKYHY